MTEIATATRGPHVHPGTRHVVAETSMGALTLVATDAALVGVYFPGHWTRPAREGFGRQGDLDTDAVLAEAHRQLEAYLAGTRTEFDLGTARHGDPFQERVWAELDTIPRGSTTTYGEIATRLGDPRLARMVGRAVGHNPLSVVVPCHRVVGKDGSLTGYAGGIERKRRLLELECAAVAAGTLF
ncbi:MAG: methylated-DNA--[protein]-cysteine S-methyltransferase [Actinomycetota bacterium]|nr:methylated-DNA--[protein]-cysteine S-methyltransferase [Actinomycetota bacterium]